MTIISSRECWLNLKLVSECLRGDVNGCKSVRHRKMKSPAPLWWMTVSMKTKRSALQLLNLYIMLRYYLTTQMLALGKNKMEDFFWGAVISAVSTVSIFYKFTSRLSWLYRSACGAIKQTFPVVITALPPKGTSGTTEQVESTDPHRKTEISILAAAWFSSKSHITPSISIHTKLMSVFANQYVCESITSM